jgi:ribonucleotide monophosphatase NagD (HAD superfamily)
VSYIRRFGRFWWEFIVGDNLPLALGAGAAIGLTALLVDKGVNAWWLLPIAILGALTAAVLRTTDTK